eukprot:tig00001094_g7006.t1
MPPVALLAPDEPGKRNYDIVVIGSGGGAKISTPSSKLGFKVALCEKGPLGGTCLNRGCIPSKMLIHVSDITREIDESSRIDIKPGPYTVDYENLIKRVADEIDAESASINPNIEKNENIDWYRSPVRFVGPKHLVTEDGREITGERIFVVAGTRPTIPDIPGLAGTPYMTSTEALRLQKKPQKMIVLGGGYIACELGHFFGGVGVDVHMLVRSTLLRFEDGEVAEEFARVFKRRYRTSERVKTTRVEHDGRLFTVHYTDADGKEHSDTADALLVAVGVTPNSDLLEVTKGGIEVDERGFVKVDERLRSTAPGVWAFGDIAGNYLFRHSANFEGEYLFETVIRAADDYPIDYTGMPHAVFSYPQVAGVGETEEQLKARGANYVKAVNKYANSAMGMALRSESGFVKLLVERGSRKILGCHIVGDQASVLIHEVLPLFRLGGRLDDILYTIHIHPALSELVRNAARRARDALAAAGDDLPLRLTLK